MLMQWNKNWFSGEKSTLWCKILTFFPHQSTKQSTEKDAITAADCPSSVPHSSSVRLRLVLLKGLVYSVVQHLQTIELLFLERQSRDPILKDKSDVNTKEQNLWTDQSYKHCLCSQRLIQLNPLCHRAPASSKTLEPYLWTIPAHWLTCSFIRSWALEFLVSQSKTILELGILDRGPNRQWKTVPITHISVTTARN